MQFLIVSLWMLSILAWFDSQLVTGKCLAAGEEGYSLPPRYVSEESGGVSFLPFLKDCEWWCVSAGLLGSSPFILAFGKVRVALQLFLEGCFSSS